MERFFNAFFNGYCKLLEALMALALAIMVCMVFGNVVLRYGFNSGIAISEELSRLLFVWLTFLGAIVALHERAHLGVDALVSKLSRPGRMACLVLTYLTVLGCGWLILRGSWEQTMINLDTVSPVSGISMAWFYGTGVVFAVSALAMTLYDLIRLATGRLRDDELVIIRESEEVDASGNPTAQA